jgi:hypothetical protein
MYLSLSHWYEFKSPYTSMFKHVIMGIMYKVSEIILDKVKFDLLKTLNIKK